MAGTVSTMTKVIRDPGVNQTGLDINDTLAVAQSMANNVDDDLFGDACIETLDRLPPMLRWDVGSALEGAVVAGSVTLQASATDDTDPNPRAEILDHPDADGDPTNNVARAEVDTTLHPDGGLVVVARATDIAGNVAMISRALVVDNTAPVVELEPTGFYVSGTTWWTAAAGPTHRRHRSGRQRRPGDTTPRRRRSSTGRSPEGRGSPVRSNPACGAAPAWPSRDPIRTRGGATSVRFWSRIAR